MLLGDRRDRLHPWTAGPAAEGVSSVLVSLYVQAQTRWGELRTRFEREDGATAVEYAIMLAFIAAVIVVSVTFLGHVTNSEFQKVKFPP
jgi:Flp pilus assembly pilin Flp